jgi:translation initiation factor IF-1
MVKNFGGNKSKKQGRKFVGDPKASKALRLPENDDEILATIIKIYGHGMCDTACIDGVERICIIRNKFRGRGKKDNLVKIGTWVLIGKRAWETVTDGKKEKCDLLEVYRDEDKKKLIQNCDKNFTELIKKTNGDDDVVEENSDIQFVDEQTQSYLNAAEQEIQDIKNGGEQVEEDDEIDLDEI